MRHKRIGLTEVKALGEGETVWDATVPLFGIRRQKSSAVTYVLKYRTGAGRQRWYTIGRHGAPWTPTSARTEARRLIGEVAKGSDPAADKGKKRRTASVADLCRDYMAAATAGRLLTRRKAAKKASTLVTDQSRIDRHIIPLLGRMPVSAVTPIDVETFMHDVAAGKSAEKAAADGLPNVTGGKGTAARTVGLLGALFAYAVRNGLREDNPVRGVVRYADGKRERRLADTEYASLGQAMAVCRVWPSARYASQFLALTGWRSGEVLGVRWSEIDLTRRVATLPDTKTGRSVRPLSRLACDLLRAIPRAGDRVFPASRGEGPMTGFPKFFGQIRKLAQLPAEVTPHVLRHSFASVAGDLGYSELTIAALLGHRSGSVTSGYVHAADAILLAAADTVANRVCELMGRIEVGPHPSAGVDRAA